jgi:phage FluMu protein Com
MFRSDVPKLSRSKEEEYFTWRLRCPRCKKFLLYDRTYEPNGRVRRIFKPTDPASLSECPRCHQRWFFYKQPDEIEVLETHQSTDELRREEIELDNSRGVSELKRTRSVSEEWTQSYTLEREETMSAGVKGTFGVDGGPKVEVTAEQALKERFAISEQKKRTFAEEISFEVPPGVVRKVTLTFKRTWQHGTIRLTPPGESPVEVPFKVVAALQMDITQVDEMAAAAS